MNFQAIRTDFQAPTRSVRAQETRKPTRARILLRCRNPDPIQFHRDIKSRQIAVNLRNGRYKISNDARRRVFTKHALLLIDQPRRNKTEVVQCQIRSGHIQHNNVAIGVDTCLHAPGGFRPFNTRGCDAQFIGSKQPIVIRNINFNATTNIE